MTIEDITESARSVTHGVSVSAKRDHRLSPRRANRKALTWVLSPFAFPSGSYVMALPGSQWV